MTFYITWKSNNSRNFLFRCSFFHSLKTLDETTNRQFRKNMIISKDIYRFPVNPIGHKQSPLIGSQNAPFFIVVEIIDRQLLVWYIIKNMKHLACAFMTTLGSEFVRRTWSATCCSGKLGFTNAFAVWGSTPSNWINLSFFAKDIHVP